MDNFDLIYDYTDSESEQDDEVNIIKDKIYNITINSLDREWTNTYIDTFSFNTKFNSSLSKNPGYGTTSLCIPVSIKNIYEIIISYIQFPIRNIILDSGNYSHISKLNGIVLTIDEFNKNCYGTNDILNKSFGTFLPTEETPNFVQLGNINQGYTFYPAPLNTINTLTFNFFDLDGMKLKYDLDRLEIKKISFDTTNKLIKLHFDVDIKKSNNYKIDDLLIFKKNNIQGLNSNILNNYLNNNTHSINSFDTNFINIKYPDSGIVNDYIEANSGEINNNLGYVLNKNLQIKIFMLIKTKEKDIKFKSELI